ncbi:MAG: hypothetical protein ACYCV7_01995 [Acidimicrobiales bacterium]
MDGPLEEMSDEQLAAIRARLDEPPPVIALAGRNRGLTPIVEYLALLREDRVDLVDEIDRLRAELRRDDTPGVSPA